MFRMITLRSAVEVPAHVDVAPPGGRDEVVTGLLRGEPPLAARGLRRTSS